MSQAGIFFVPGTGPSPPDVPTSFGTNSGGPAVPVANEINIFAEYVSADGVPIQTLGFGNIVEIQAQLSSASASSSASNAGLVSFNSADFVVDANGFVSLTGSAAFVWNLVTSSSPANPIQIVKQNGYSCQGIAMVTFTLPLVPNFGDTFIIASTTSTFQISSNAGQKMRIGDVISTAGSGTATSNAAGDIIEMVYMGSNIFQSLFVQGTITLT